MRLCMCVTGLKRKTNVGQSQKLLGLIQQTALMIFCVRELKKEKEVEMPEYETEEEAIV